MATQPDRLPAAAERVAQILTDLGAAGEVTMLDTSARTAAEAAASLGCGVEQIAKSIVFRRVADSAPVVVIASGTNRVSVDKVAAAVGDIAKADAEFVRTATGYAIGGVSPVGHASGTVLIVDQDLARYECVWAAAGHPHAVFPTTAAELCAWTGSPLSDIRAD